MSDDEEVDYDWSATYSPEDNKLRLYYDGFGRFTDDDKERIKSAGYKWASKQECYVAPRWTPKAEDMALEMAGEIGDEDYSPLERSADRAERFGTYRDKRSGEAHDRADTFEAGPSAFGHQNQQRAERQAARHDRHRVKAVSQWSKAEYWQSRTEGVISHALYRARPDVRRERIRNLESEIRIAKSYYTPAEPRQEYTDSEGVKYVWCGKGRSGRWVNVADLEAIEKAYARSIAHNELRLAYENQMLESEGGMAGDLEIVPGGWIRSNNRSLRYGKSDGGWWQIQQVHKSPATGRVTSVKVLAPSSSNYDKDGKSWTDENPRPMVLHMIKVTRLGEDVYRAPTTAELEFFQMEQKRAKEKAKASAPKKPKLINPTNEDAERLQKLWNDHGARLHAKAKEEHRLYGDFEPATVRFMTQKQYSANSKGSYTHLETVEVCEDGLKPRYSYGRRDDKRKTAFKVRESYFGGSSTLSPNRVIVLTDKPQKPLPLDWDNLGTDKDAAPKEQAELFA